MNKIIIGIHGLRNKPPPDMLASWWHKSIKEGFHALNKPAPHFEFDMAYWAHFMHPESQNPDLNDPGHPLFLDEHYESGNFYGPRDPGPFWNRMWCEVKRQFLLETAGRFGLSRRYLISNIILRTMFKELDIYYHKSLKDGEGDDCPARDLIRGELAARLRHYRDRDIMLVAHSMGCIIVYDVLTHTVPDIPVHTLVTMGAPLGFPLVVRKIRAEQEVSYGPENRLHTPECITRHWYNFSDVEDVTALNYNLRSIYLENRHGVRPFDNIVYNNYESKGRLNPHKSYGYLRTADVTRAVEEFLGA
jgi:hypothetical protein